MRACRKGDALKNELAGDLIKRTPMTVRWIAQKLIAGSPGSLWNALGKVRKAGGWRRGK